MVLKNSALGLNFTTGITTVVVVPVVTNMVVLKNSALGLNFQFHDLAKNHTLFNGNVYPTKNFRHGLKNSALITQAKCNSSPSGLRPSGLEFAFCFRDSGGIFQSITQIFVGFPQWILSVIPL